MRASAARAGRATAVYYGVFVSLVVLWYVGNGDLLPLLGVFARAARSRSSRPSLGLACGVWSDRSDVPAPERRGDYVVLEADMHAHTRFSQGCSRPSIW